MFIKSADQTKLGGVEDRPDGCATIQRDMDELEEWTEENSFCLTKGNAKSCP